MFANEQHHGHCDKKEDQLESIVNEDDEAS